MEKPTTQCSACKCFKGDVQTSCSLETVVGKRSLYPSLYRAYNLCYSTLVHRDDVDTVGRDNCTVRGCAQDAHLHVSSFVVIAVVIAAPALPLVWAHARVWACKIWIRGMTAKIRACQTTTQNPQITPTGAAFVKPAVRPGVLPDILAALMTARWVVE